MNKKDEEQRKEQSTNDDTSDKEARKPIAPTSAESGIRPVETQGEDPTKIDDKDKMPALVSPSAKPKPRSSKSKAIFKIFGPGIITGASDDDPSGIATYSQVGAQFGFGMLWMVLFLYPLMTVVQEMCARIGLLTGGGLAGIIKKRYSKKIVYPIVSLLLIANTINIGVNIGAMSASVRLIFPQVPFVAVSLAFAAFILLAEILVPYERYVKILKYLTLSLFAYVATAVIVGGNLEQVLTATIIPDIDFSPDFAMLFVAVVGTTISPYLFFWQA